MMKFSCEKALLQSAIAVTSRAVAQKSSIPALEGLLLHAETYLTISGYNMQTGIRTRVSADVTDGGDIVLNARLFGDIIRRMPDDVVTTGLYAGEADYGNIPIQEKEGVRIAYLAYTETTNGLPTPSDAAANVIYTSQEDVIQQQIELARQQADIVVVGVHWGVEGSHTPTDAQHALGQKIADWGADVIIGTHPHVIQPVELLTAAGTGKTVPIAYSLGNFVSTQAAANNMVGVILTFDITKTTQPDGSASASVGNVHAVPMVMHYDSNYTNARAYLYRDYTEELAAAHGVRARFSGFSKEYITQLLTEYISPEFLVLE